MASAVRFFHPSNGRNPVKSSIYRSSSILLARMRKHRSTISPGHNAERVMRLGGVEDAAADGEVLEPQFIHESRAHLGKLQCHLTSIAGDCYGRHSFRAAVAIRPAVGWR